MQNSLSLVPASRFPRWLRVTIGVLVPLVLFIGLPWWVMNEIARRAWLDTQAMFAREGETLEFRVLLTPPVAEEHNFCGASGLLGIAGPSDESGPHAGEGRRNREMIEKLFKMKEAFVKRSGSGPMTGRSFSLVEAAKEISAPDDATAPMSADEALRLLHAVLDPREAFLAELAPRLDLPRSQLDPALSALALPQPLVSLKIPEGSSFLHLVKGLRLRAAVACAEGNSARSVESVRMLLRLFSAEADKPTEINLRFAHVALAFAVEAIWQMSDEQQGSVELWTLLETELASCNVPASTLRAARGELALTINYVLYASERGIPAGASVFLDSSVPIWLSRFAPEGLYFNNASAHVKLCVEYILRPLRSGNWSEVLRGSRDLDKITAEAKAHPFRNISLYCSAVTFPSSIAALRQCIYSQSTLNQAIVACAVERFRLEHGVYPDSLTSLTRADGSPLAPDPISGQPIRYRKSDERRYRLWCVNFSGTDHEGKRGTLPFKRDNTDADWVWGFEG